MSPLKTPRWSARASLQLEYLGGTPRRLGHVAGEHAEPGEPDEGASLGVGVGALLGHLQQPFEQARARSWRPTSARNWATIPLQAHRPSHACS